MPDLHIRHLDLRIIRRGGWSWGLEPKKLVQAAVEALPLLLAQRLAGAVGEDVDDVHITTPINLRVPIGIDELAAMANAGSAATAAVGLRERIDVALAESLAAVRWGDAEQHVAMRNSLEETSRSIDPATESPTMHPLLRALLRWHRQGVLVQRLALFDPPAMQRWHDKLTGIDHGGPPPSSAAFAEVIASLVAAHSPIPSTPHERMLYRVLLVIESCARCGGLPAANALVRVLNEHIPLVATQRPAAVTTDAEPNANSRSSGSTSITAVQCGATGEPSTWEAEVDSVLPFLLLTPLASAGYLDALAAALSDAEPSVGRALAAALAMKVLSVSKSSGSFAGPSSAAVFAAVNSDRMIDLTPLGQFAGQVSPADAAITASIIEGHDPASPLILIKQPTPPSYVLFDIDGVVPIAAGDEFALLRRVLASFESPLVLVSTSAASVLSELHARGARFLTDAPPTARERWRNIREARTGSFWTNDLDTSESRLLSDAQSLVGFAPLAETVLEQLHARRSTRGASTDVEWSLSSAAASACATIAWTLWRTRETPHPLLVVQRFADFGGVVRFSPDAVEVVVPLGRRAMDLCSHGLLADVHDVPWLGHRRVSFRQG